MSDPMTRFVAPMCDAFAAPEQGRRFLDRLAATLAEFSDAALSEAAQAIILTRKVRSFPTIAECVEACENPRAVKARRASKARRAEHCDDETATRLLRSDVGRRAAVEGWVAELYMFLGRKGRHPSDAEERALRERAARMQGCGWYQQSNAAKIVERLRGIANEQR
jgi:hypothetical protein